MSEEFWVNIKKDSLFYIVEKWTATEDRILYVEKKKRLTRWGAKKYARRCIIINVCEKYIREKT